MMYRFVFAALLAVAFADEPRWQARPDGPDTWTVSKTYGRPGAWAFDPDHEGDAGATVDVCRGVPDERTAEFIATALNGRKR